MKKTNIKKDLSNKVKEICSGSTIRGITLISLVVTIIVLIILAGISINLLIGNDGMITRAKNAKEQYQNAQDTENNDTKKIVNQIDQYTTKYYIWNKYEAKNSIVEYKYKYYSESGMTPGYPKGRYCSSLSACFNKQKGLWEPDIQENLEDYTDEELSNFLVGKYCGTTVTGGGFVKIKQISSITNVQRTEGKIVSFLISGNRGYETEAVYGYTNSNIFIETVQSESQDSFPEDGFYEGYWYTRQ